MNIFGKPNHQRGTSALDLISTLSVSLTLMTLGVPAVQNLTVSSSMSSAINTMGTHLNIARSEAITRNMYTALCPSSDGQQCLNDFAWHGGFILFVDADKDKVRDTDEQILRNYQPESNHTKIFTTTGRRVIQYKPSGILAGFSNTTFTFCDPGEKLAPKKITIRNGRLHYSDDGDSSRCL